MLSINTHTGYDSIVYNNNIVINIAVTSYIVVDDFELLADITMYVVFKNHLEMFPV